MKIKQAEELAGISSKNIRFYEEQGLLQPKRSENGYRNYSIEDVELLKRIKFLRKLGTPVDEILKLFQGNISMAECLENRKAALEKEKKNVERMHMLAEQMLEQNPSIYDMDIDFWLDEMEKMEKEGTSFLNVSMLDRRKRKKVGAIASAGVMLAFMIGLILFDFWGWMTDPEMPIGIFLLLFAIAVVIAAGTLVAVFNRMKEIDGGEEDEAAKY